MNPSGILLPSGRFTNIPGVYPNGGPGAQVMVAVPAPPPPIVANGFSAPPVYLLNSDTPQVGLSVVPWMVGYSAAWSIDDTVTVIGYSPDQQEVIVEVDSVIAYFNYSATVTNGTTASTTLDGTLQCWNVPDTGIFYITLSVDPSTITPGMAGVVATLSMPAFWVNGPGSGYAMTWSLTGPGVITTDLNDPSTCTFDVNADANPGDQLVLTATYNTTWQDPQSVSITITLAPSHPGFAYFDPEVTQYSILYMQNNDGTQGLYYPYGFITGWIATADVPVTWSWEITGGDMLNCTSNGGSPYGQYGPGGAPYTTQPVTIVDGVQPDTTTHSYRNIAFPWGGYTQTVHVAVTATNGIGQQETVSQDCTVVMCPFIIVADNIISVSFDGDQMLDQAGNPVPDNTLSIGIRIMRRPGMTDPIDVNLVGGLTGNGDYGDLGGVPLVQSGQTYLGDAPDYFTLNYTAPTAASFRPWSSSGTFDPNDQMFAIASSISALTVPNEPTVFANNPGLTGWGLLS